MNGHVFTISAFKTYSNKARCGQPTVTLDDNGRIFSETDRIDVIVGRLAGVFNNGIVERERAAAFVPCDCSALDEWAVEMSVCIGADVANGDFSNSTECRYK